MAQPIIANIIQTVSASPLNDQEAGFPFVRWTVPDLTDYFNQALIEIANYRPDAFAQITDIRLISGSVQGIPAGFSFLNTIVKNSDTSPSLCPDAPITQCDVNLMRTFYKKPCLPTGGPNDYRVVNYAYDAKNPLIFYVDPPVPTGNQAMVTAVLIAQPTQWTQTGGGTSLTWTPSQDLMIDPKYYTIIRYFIAAKAFEVDTESVLSQQNSQGLYKKFYNALGVQYKQGSDFSRGKFMGQGGDNQMTKERVA